MIQNNDSQRIARARFKFRLFESEAAVALNFKFERKNGAQTGQEIITNISKLQIQCALFFTLKSRPGLKFEDFLRNTLPRLSKTEFESHVFSPVNLEICGNLVNLFTSLMSNCSSCRPFEFCVKCWKYLSSFFDFNPPPNVDINNEDIADIHGKKSAEKTRIIAIQTSL